MRLNSLRDLDIAILAGGLATRLAHVMPDVPKILAPVGNNTFLDYLLKWLAGQGAAHVVLCLGHLARGVQERLAVSRTYGLDISVTVEPRPLGTAGAVAFAYPLLKSDPVMVMNGDTFVDVDLVQFLQAHNKSDAVASVLCAWVEQAGRYGRIDIDEHDRVARFVEKDGSVDPSWISAGVYLFGRPILQQVERCVGGSLERDVLQVLPPHTIHAFKTNGPFLDIGTPEALARASKLFA